MKDENYIHDEAKVEKARLQAERETDEHISKLNEHWRKDHDKRIKAIESELLRSRGAIGADERLVLNLASHDVSLSQILGEAEVLLAQRVAALIDKLQTASALAKTLLTVSKCRAAAETRALEALQVAGVLRGQRRITQTPHLRRVA